MAKTGTPRSPNQTDPTVKRNPPEPGNAQLEQSGEGDRRRQQQDAKRGDSADITRADDPNPPQ